MIYNGLLIINLIKLEILIRIQGMNMSVGLVKEFGTSKSMVYMVITKQNSCCRRYSILSEFQFSYVITTDLQME